ncbi:thiamine-phosphate kinase [Roseofilum casamattae]|uniref:Thiamine-monophosphate kinase n=1 Tax=Roseofilum casamattae BLCC-M143 TaxID=3022442 RepID=A0ABT7C1J0_9CYAN|nr:thiamine-phosphate kinase [Roseofilum casamattae]MDJ1184624.1 thiamine-phosphate kinase [Roseofilum casamattae BLCC-M143]
MKVSDIGERGLLERLFPFCAAEVVGDDGALISTSAALELAVTTDVLVDGIHFSDRTTPPHAVGWRAAAANLSDLAAMGASPLGITVGLSLTPDTAVSWVEELYGGMRDCLQEYGTAILGGDIVRSPVNSLSITAFGEVNPRYAIERHTGEVGDLLVVTGVHGASRAGLECLLNPEWGNIFAPGDRQLAIQAHQYPRPRLDLLPHLRATFCPRITGMDSSDGLADAIEQICRASEVGACIDVSTIPYPSYFNSVLSEDVLFLWEHELFQWVLYGGEDFELVLAMPADVAHKLCDRVGEIVIIGELVEGDAIELQGLSTKNPNKTIEGRWGFQHFS